MLSKLTFFIIYKASLLNNFIREIRCKTIFLSIKYKKTKKSLFKLFYFIVDELIQVIL